MGEKTGGTDCGNKIISLKIKSLCFIKIQKIKMKLLANVLLVEAIKKPKCFWEKNRGALIAVTKTKPSITNLNRG